MKNRNLLIISILILSLALAACSTQPQSSTQQAPINAYGNSAPTQMNAEPTSPVSDSTIMISMKGSRFSPEVITIRAGTTVTWTNEDSIIHTVTSDTDLFDSGNMGNGKSFSYTFTTAGTYTYHCIPHKATMIGTIVVTD